MQSDDLDRILDRALDSYGAVEPGAGLEERILRRTREERGRLHVAWRWAAAAAACLLAVAAVWQTGVFRREHAVPRMAPEVVRVAPQSTPAFGQPALPVEREGAAIRPGHRDRVAARSVVAVKAAPKLEIFSPPPLTAEEKLMVEFVTQHPKEAAELAQEQERQAEPIRIAAIEIKPLVIERLQQREDTGDAKDK